jgi:hypothetical protein
MEEKKVNQKEFSTCLEGLSCAEMMKKMTGQHGVGSLCEEMMKKGEENVIWREGDKFSNGDDNDQDGSRCKSFSWRAD